MIRTGIIVAIIAFMASLVVFYITTPTEGVPSQTSTSSIIDKLAATPESTSTLRKIDASVVAKTSLFLNSFLIDLADWLDNMKGHGTLRKIQDAASSSISNVVCTPDSANFTCDNSGDRFQAPELNVCGCMPKTCASSQHIKVTSRPNEFWSNGTIKGRFECVDN